MPEYKAAALFGATATHAGTTSSEQTAIEILCLADAWLHRERDGIETLCAQFESQPVSQRHSGKRGHDSVVHADEKTIFDSPRGSCQDAVRRLVPAVPSAPIQIDALSAPQTQHDTFQQDLPWGENLLLAGREAGIFQRGHPAIQVGEVPPSTIPPRSLPVAVRPRPQPEVGLVRPGRKVVPAALGRRAGERRDLVALETQDRELLVGPEEKVLGSFAGVPEVVRLPSAADAASCALRMYRRSRLVAQLVG